MKTTCPQSSRLLFVPVYAGHLGVLEPLIRSLAGQEAPAHLLLNPNMALPHTMAPMLGREVVPVELELANPDNLVARASRGAAAGKLLRLKQLLHIKGELSSLLDRLNPEMIVITNEGDHLSSILLELARRRGIPSIFLFCSMMLRTEARRALVGGQAAARVGWGQRAQTGLLRALGLPGPTQGPGQGAASRVCLWSEDQKEIVLKRGAPPQKLVVCGYPLVDKVRSLDDALREQTKASVRSKLGLEATDDYLLLLTQPVYSHGIYPEEQYIGLLKETLKVLCDTLPLKVVMKFHPRESERVRAAFAANGGIRVVTAGEGDVNICDLVSACSLMATHWSSTAIEGMLFNKRILLLDYFKVNDPMRFVREAGLSAVSGVEELKEIAPQLPAWASAAYDEGFLAKHNLQPKDSPTARVAEVAAGLLRQARSG